MRTATPALLSAAPRGDTLPLPDSDWEVRTDIAQGPKSGPPPVDEATHFLEAPAVDPYDIRATGPLPAAIPYAVATASTRPLEVSRPPPRVSASDVLRSFDHVVGRLDTDDDWTGSRDALRSSYPASPSPPSYAPPAPWVDPRGVISTPPVFSPAPRKARRRWPWVLAVLLVLSTVVAIVVVLWFL